MICEKWQKADGRFVKVSWLVENNPYVFDAYVDSLTHDIFFIPRCRANILYSMR